MNVMLAAGLVLAILAAAAAAFAVLNRPRLVVVDARVAADFPATGFTHSSFEALMKRYVDEHGDVNYAGWHKNGEDRNSLNEYLAAISAFSPDTTPERFPKSSNALAYWLNSYNAYVIYGVLTHWPLESVTDLKAPLEIRTGLGFFWQQRYLFGGEALSLYAVENDIIRERFRDPRIHFVLNCASASCPVARPELPDGEDLEPLLREAAIDFVSDERNVRVDHDNRKVMLSDIFKWYKKDFANDLRMSGTPSDRPLIDYLKTISPPDLARDLGKAEGYTIEFIDYDWAINDSEAV